MPSPRLHLVFDPEGDDLDEARACEAEVFLRWYGNSEAQLLEEYGPYEAASTFLALAREDARVVGTCRLISPSKLGLKTLVDLERPPWGIDGSRSAASVDLDPATTWDVGTLGIRSGLTGSDLRVAAALYHGLVLVARANQVHSFVAILDDRLRRLFRSMGLVLHTLPGASSGEYLGSASSTPIYAHFASLLDQQRRTEPETYRLVTMGEGLDLVIPDPAAFVLKPRVVDLTAFDDRSAAQPGARSRG